MRIDGKRFLITGASGGIGRAIVEKLLDEGAYALLVGRDRTTLQRAADRVDPAGDRTLVFACDLVKSADRAQLCAVASSWQGGVDVLINNAGVTSFAPFATQSSDGLERIIDTNLVVPMDLSRRLLPHFSRKPEARIVNIGSVFGNIGFACNTAYSASKFGLRGFSEALRRELGGTSVSVLYFAPRATRTQFNSAAVDALNAQLRNAVDDPAEVASRLVHALRKDRHEYIVGWPEKLFASLNAVVPRIVDRALRKQLWLVQQHAVSREGAHGAISNLEESR
jgi:short-subunit dehydrogenase